LRKVQPKDRVRSYPQEMRAGFFVVIAVLLGAPRAEAMYAAGSHARSLRELTTDADLVVAIDITDVPSPRAPLHAVVNATFKGPLVGDTITIVGEHNAALHQGTHALVFLRIVNAPSLSFARVPGSPAIPLDGERVAIENLADVDGFAEPRWRREAMPREQFLGLVAKFARVSGEDVVAPLPKAKQVSLTDVGLGKDCGPMLGWESTSNPPAAQCMRDAFASCEPAFSIFADAPFGCRVGEPPLDKSRRLFVVTPTAHGCVMTMIEGIERDEKIVSECKSMRAHEPSMRRFRDELGDCSLVKRVVAADAHFP
jgi:hypothetical protein